MADQLHELQGFARTTHRFAFRDTAHLQPEADVVQHRHMRKQRVVLKHHAKATFLWRQDVDALVIEPDAAACQRLQSGDAIERRGLAAPRGTKQRDELAAPDVQVEALQRGHSVAFSIRETAAHRVEAQLFEMMLHGGFLILAVLWSYDVPDAAARIVRMLSPVALAVVMDPTNAAGGPDLLALLRADIPVPLLKRRDHRGGIQW